MDADLHKLAGLDGSEFEDYLEEIAGNCLMKGVSLGATAGYTKEEMDAVHNVAFNLYQQNKFEDSKNLFMFLCLYEQMEKDYWMGLGGCYQMLKLYEKAITAYGSASYIDPSDPTPAFHAGECYLAQDDIENLRKTIVAIKTIEKLGMDNAKDYKDIFTRTKYMEESLASE